MTVDELKMPELDCKIILGNTYHLGNRPGGDTMAAMGGLHSFMAWDRCLLTDSGGFQMVSLLHLAKITEDGVLFASPSDGSEMLLTPEMSMQLQNKIGASGLAMRRRVGGGAYCAAAGSDIMMALDDVVPSTTEDPARFVEACHRTLRWIDRCIAAHGRKGEQNLFGIVQVRRRGRCVPPRGGRPRVCVVTHECGAPQGGLDCAPGGLRDVSLAGMLERDADLPGYAIGGLAGAPAAANATRRMRHARTARRTGQAQPHTHAHISAHACTHIHTRADTHTRACLYTHTHLRFL